MDAKVLLFYEKEGVLFSFLYSKTYFSANMFRIPAGVGPVQPVMKLKASGKLPKVVILCGCSQKML